LDNLLLFIFLALLAEILGTIGGFGSSLFFVPLAGYFLEFHSVLGITALFHVSSNLVKIAFFHKGFDRKLLLRIGIPAVVSVVAGAWLSQYFESDILELMLSVFLILIAVFLLIFRNYSLKPGIGSSIIGGSISGFIAGLIGTGGAVRGLTLAAFSLQKEVFIATSAMIDFMIDASRSVVYFFNGYIPDEASYLIPILLCVSIVGTYLGKLILVRISEAHFKAIVLVFVLVTGLATLSKTLFF
jgi:uncharacterized membrane protein YfcA